MSDWNRRWRSAIDSVSQELLQRRPLLQAEREELMTFHLHVQFKSVSRTDVESKAAYRLLYFSLGNLRPSGVSEGFGLSSRP